MSRFQKVLLNPYLIGWAYLIALLNYDFMFFRGEARGVGALLIQIVIIVIKILSFLLAGKFMIQGLGKNFGRYFLYFMMVIAMFHFGSILIPSAIDYNFIVILSVPWFFYFDSKSN
ncbi:hypothetical protein Belba_2133 [Belliella baltica DSM 15883]|uniref:Uncharacterized protein n=1 Tax=Belliella baltica (strain DSM 15883 / CIP 108006 / LMG 21964 / BA134) TaxID=866536 RepID=I3Z632_BELBD|nr:hypothetical protein [Belliella baltica]AFL84700.1 hypothetical protein Belba_2133 [Belliella baltica DSM 15883]